MYDWLARAAQRRPDTVAIEHGADALSYTALLRQVSERHADAQADERVVLPGDDAREFAIGLHAALSRGAVALPLRPPPPR
jgi:acyl-CoA synthetase (AMP-forming)/AMP-acid ligase II